jgi:uncharacterized protein YchJ
MTEQQLDAMKQALAYMAGTLKTDHVTGYDRKQCVMQNLRTAIHATELREQAEQQWQGEPVAWMSPSGNLYRTRYHAVANGEQAVTPLYTTPPNVATPLATQPAPQRSKDTEWVGLTDEEIFETHKQVDSMQYLTFGKAIEAKLREKNSL